MAVIPYISDIRLRMIKPFLRSTSDFEVGYPISHARTCARQGEIE